MTQFDSFADQMGVVRALAYAKQPIREELLKLVDRVIDLINSSPLAFHDAAHDIGQTQDLILNALASKIENLSDAQRTDLKKIEKQLLNKRLSRAGQTEPSWLGRTTAVIYDSVVPCLDGGDDYDCADDSGYETDISTIESARYIREDAMLFAEIAGDYLDDSDSTT